MDNKTVLDPYTLTGVTVTDRVLGHGSYATILELQYMGLKCAGKKIHELLLRQGSDSYTVSRFEQECRLLSQVRHPNIVQFLGVHFQQGMPAPILVMEFLSTNLTSCIEQYCILPKEISYSILYDVALGLCYLHSQTPPIIHRDLSSNNVLLTPNMTAKISDLGVARILNLTSLQVSRMTQTPGTPAYMPPEVMVANPKYDTSIDVFSYGILMIHMFSGMWPEPQVGPSQVDGDRLVPVTEAERREVYLDCIQNDHPLMDLILRCINNDAKLRAKLSEIVDRLRDMVAASFAFMDRLKLVKCIEDQEQENSALTVTLDNTSLENSQLKEKIEDVENILTLTVEQLKQQDKYLEAERTLHELQCVQLDKEYEHAKRNIESELQIKKEEIEAKNEALKVKDEIISKLTEQLTIAKEYLSSKQQVRITEFS